MSWALSAGMMYPALIIAYDFAATGGRVPEQGNSTMDVYSHGMPGRQSQAAEQVSAMIFGSGA